MWSRWFANRGSTCRVYDCRQRGSNKGWAVKTMEKKASHLDIFLYVLVYLCARSACRQRCSNKGWAVKTMEKKASHLDIFLYVLVYLCARSACMRLCACVVESFDIISNSVCRLYIFHSHTRIVLSYT